MYALALPSTCVERHPNHLFTAEVNGTWMGTAKTMAVRESAQLFLCLFLKGAPGAC